MAQIDTFFQQRDKRRWLTDRAASSVIKLGGISVLLALLLLIFYLVLVIIPIFSPASMQQEGKYSLTHNDIKNQTVAVGIDDDGKTIFQFTQDGQLIFSRLANHLKDKQLNDKQSNEKQSALPSSTLLAEQVVDSPVAFKAAEISSRWYAYSDTTGHIYAIQPKFSSVFTQQGRQASPSFTTFANNPVLLDPQGEAVVRFDFTIQKHSAFFVGKNETGQWQAVKFELHQRFGESNPRSDWRQTRIQMPNITADEKDVVLTPDGQTLYLLYADAISVFKLHADQFVLRETVAIHESSKNNNIQSEQPIEGVQLDLLSGAYSLLLTESNGRVSQWFDVLENGERHFTRIRNFAEKSHDSTSLLLPDFYRKGFYRFDSSGEVENYFTTAADKILDKKMADSAPVAAASSSSESYLLAVFPQYLSVWQVNNPHPDISFKALWQKVWYEGYPEPDYIWQSTSGSNDFEAKFSLVPIAFGTLKSALFAMLFAVPIAIFGAIYTAYFMTPKMRRYVKPTIELMEALPTVIIGFLAGLWLAPIVELNLLNTILFILLLPVVILLAAVVWNPLRYRVGTKAQGWIALILIPVIAAFAWLISAYGHKLELWIFGGDIRFYLASLGIDFDQRNAMIVGFAMGFAVIPTIFTIAEDAIFSVPKHLSDGASALGATSWQCLTTVVLVTASPGIFSAVMMGLGRAVGETMIVLMATGNTPVMDWNILEGMRTLSANIAIEMPESEVGSSHFRLLFLSAFLLFAFTFVVNSLAEFIRQRLRDKYSAL